MQRTISWRRWFGWPRRLTMAILREGSIALARATAGFRRADVAIFFRFRSPPYGGGNQFLWALRGELERRGLCIENNTISATTRACLFNSHHFDVERLRRLRRAGCRMVHRVDGPIDVYRARDGGSDRYIWQVNRELADVTIFQSSYSLRAHLDLGMRFVSPRVIMNAADPNIFHAGGRVPFSRDRRIRLVTASWSAHPNKGAEIYEWLDQHLDQTRFEFTFVGRSRVRFENARMVEPIPSDQLAQVLRQHDVYVAASRHDPCSNALIEALSCGLPAIYLSSGGHPEIVGQAGLGFQHVTETPALLDRMVDEYERFQSLISLPTLADVADEYLAAMGVGT